MSLQNEGDADHGRRISLVVLFVKKIECATVVTVVKVIDWYLVWCVVQR